jgi:hypothetical protein
MGAQMTRLIYHVFKNIVLVAYRLVQRSRLPVEKQKPALAVVPGVNVHCSLAPSVQSIFGKALPGHPMASRYF